MSNATNTAGDLNQVIASAVQARIETEVGAALAGSDLMAQYVAAALHQKIQVEDRGSYRKRETTFLTETINGAIQRATKAAVEKVVADEAPAIEKAVTVVDDFIRRALHDLQRGKKTGRAKQYFEDIRDDARIKDAEGKPYKLNNSFTSLMARHVMEIEPRLRGFFRTRALHHELREVAPPAPHPTSARRDIAPNEGAAGDAAPSHPSRDTPHSREAGAVAASPDVTAPAPSFPANQSGGAKAGLAAGMAATLGNAPTLFEDDGPGLVGPAWNRRPGRAA